MELYIVRRAEYMKFLDLEKLIAAHILDGYLYSISPLSRICLRGF